MDSIKNSMNSMKIGYDAEDPEKLKNDINIFEKWVKQIFEVDTKNVEPVHYSFKGENVQREDVALISDKQNGIFKTADNYEEGHYRVPPIIE